MLPSTDLKVAYLVKRYPRYSETFIVNEILAHERAGLSIEIFSLRPPVDTHFQDRIASVQSPVRYLTGTASKASAFWDALREAANLFPDLWRHLDESSEASAAEVQQALILARHVRRSGIDHVHAHFATEPTTVARLAAKFAGVGYSFTAHAKDIFHEDASHDDRWQKLCDAAAVVTVSDFNREYLHETFGAAADRVRRIYNGIDLEALPYTPPTARKPVIAAVGRLVEKKGFDVLIDACGRLADEGVEFTCQIVGTGDLERRLRDQIARRGLEGHVQMLGPRPQEEVFALVRHAAVLAVPCVVGKDGNRDGLPTVLLEAMALGTPCVSTDVTGIPEVIRHRQTGLLARQGDPDSLAEGLKELLHDSALRLRLAEAARELVEEQKQRRSLVDESSAEATAGRIFEAASGLLAVSQEVAEYLVRSGVQRDRILVTPNGVDGDRFANPVQPARERRPDEFTIGFVGTLKPWHGLDHLLDAMQRLYRDDPSVRLLIVGDGPLRESLQDDLLSRGAGLAAAAEFVGSVAHDEIPAWLASMDAVVAPYPDLPGFYFSPLKLFEYMASGRPVVASRIGQVAEMIEDGVNGILTTPGDAASLADALRRLRVDRSLGERIGRVAQQEILNNHSWDAVVERLLGWGTNLPSRRHPAPLKGAS